MLMQGVEGSSLIYLGDNENYRVGDIVIVEPISSQLHRGETSMDSRASKRTAIDSSTHDKNAPVCALEGMDEVDSTGDRTSLVVALGPGFYKPNQ